MGYFSVVNCSSCVLHLQSWLCPSRALVSGDRGLGPLDRVEQPPGRRPQTNTPRPPRPPASQTKHQKGRVPQRAWRPVMAKGVPHTPAVEPRPREVRPPHSSPGCSLVDPLHPKPSWWEEGAPVRVKKSNSFRMWWWAPGPPGVGLPEALCLST